MAALVNYSAVLQDADGSNLRFVANEHTFQTWGAGQSATSALSGILASSNQTTVMTVLGANVGIGTTTPATALHVQGSGIISGNVGIGTTTTPSTSLYVAGDANITGNISAGNLGMFRNRVINGDMRVDQRNAGNAGNSGFGPDRFRVVGSNCATSVLPRRIELTPDDVAATGGNFQYATSLSTIAGPTAGLSSYLSFNSNITDVMGGLVNPTVTGTIRYVPGVVGSGTASALYLANEGNVLTTSTRASNYITFPYIQSSALTVSCWFNFNKLVQANGQYIVPWSFSTSTGASFYLEISYLSATNSTLKLVYFNTAGGLSYISSIIITTNKWYHIVATFVPSTSSSLYVDGLLIGTSTTSVPSIFAYNTTFIIGDLYSSGSGFYPFAGYIDDFRIYNRALGSGEIALLAGLTTGVTSAPAGTSLAAYYPFDGSTAESSGNAGPALTTTGSVSYVTGFDGVANASVYLANDGNVLATPTKAANQFSAAFTASTFPITTSFWVRFTKLPFINQLSTVFAYGNSSGAFYQIYAEYLSATTANLYGWATNGSTPFIIRTGIWYHITTVWTQSSTLSFYVNGSHISTTVAASASTTGTLYFGDDPRTAVFRPFAGYIDDFRIYNRALTSAEIAYLSGNAIYPSIQTFNQAAYFPFDGSLTDSSGNGVTLTPTGTMQYVTGVTGTQALYLANEANTTAGTTSANYLTNTTLSISAMGAFTVGCWVLVTRLGATSMPFFSTNPTASAITNSVQIYITNAAPFRFASDFYGTSGIVGTTVISINIWYHVAISYSGTATSLYVNGAREGVNSGTVPSTTGFRISNIFTTYPGAFSGYIDDFRIYSTALTQSQIAALYYGSAHIANQTTPYLGYVPSSAVLYQQSIEGNNVADLFYGTANAKPATLSLWLKNVTASTQTFTLALNNGGASGASRSVLYSIASVAPNAWRRVVINVPGDLLGTWLKDNGLGLNIALVLGANSGALSGTTGAWQTGAYFAADSSQNYAASATNFLALQDNAVYVTGVQLEKGALATPFEFRPLQVELQLCQRYFIKLINQNLGLTFNASDLYNGSFAIPNMRISPTLDSGGVYEVNAGSSGTVILRTGAGPRLNNYSLMFYNSAGNWSTTVFVNVTCGINAEI